MITDSIQIEVQKTTKSNLAKVDFDNIKFGRQFSDHMFVAEYDGSAWVNAKIIPYGDLSMSPASSVIHYGQAVFEGMKAYKRDGQVYLFRPEDNAERLNKSAERMCMPPLPTDLFLEAVNQLLTLDSGWVPTNEDSSLYIRPFMFATDDYIGVKPSDTYKFMIFTCPVNAYYGEPVNVKVEEHYTRSMDGGVGFAKAAGNYAASLYPAKQAQKEGYHQLIWTDHKEHRFIEESGTMNIIFEIDGKLITPPASETILAGITKDSVLQVARHWGLTVEERSIEVSEVLEALENGTLTDAFGAGTAATIAHIGMIGYRGKQYQLPPVESRGFSNKVFAFLNDLKRGKVEDTFGWVKHV